MKYPHVILIALVALLTHCSGLGIVYYSEPNTHAVNERDSILQYKLRGYETRYGNVFQAQVQDLTVAVKVNNERESGLSFGPLMFPIIPLIGFDYGYGFAPRNDINATASVFITVAFTAPADKEYVFNPCDVEIIKNNAERIKPVGYSDTFNFAYLNKKAVKLNYSEEIKDVDGLTDCSTEGGGIPLTKSTQVLIKFAVPLSPTDTFQVSLPAITSDEHDDVDVPIINFHPKRGIIYSPFVVSTATLRFIY